MNNFLEIFKQRTGIVAAYHDCLFGDNRHLLSAFRHELFAVIETLAAEVEVYRLSDETLFRIGQDLLIKLTQISSMIPIDISLDSSRDTRPIKEHGITQKLDRELSRTRTLVMQNDRKFGQVKAY